MRPISQIKADIQFHNDQIKGLTEDLKLIVSHCPHPSPFVAVKSEDSEDDCGGPGIYEFTWITYTCSLCEGKFQGKYNKRTDLQPKLEDLV